MSELTLKYPTFKSLPFSVKIYISVLLIIFSPFCVVILKKGPFNAINWSDFIVFLITASILSAKSVLKTNKGESLHIASILWFASILLFRPETAIILIFISNYLGEIVEKTPKWAMIINTVELCMAYYFASLALLILNPFVPYSQNIVPSIPAFIIAVIIIVAFNLIAHLMVYIMLYKESFTDALKEIGKGLFIYELSQYPISILLALTYHYQRVSIVLFILPIFFYYLSSRYESRIQQKEREAVEEKRRIEQDAHDRIYNRLGALAKKAELALDSPAQMEPTLTLIKDDLQKSVADLQKIIRGEVEVAEITEENYLHKELAQICEAFKNKSDVKLSFNCDESLVANIAPQHFWHLQCIIEECLNNIHKHSKASEASVQLQKEDGSLVVSISDNGVGFDMSNVKSQILNVNNKPGTRMTGLGLGGMQERAKKIGAEISVGANNGSGTKIELRLPRSASPRSQ